MMKKDVNSIGDLLKKKADDIDGAGIRDDLGLIQDELQRLFDGEVKATHFNDDGVVVIVTRSSSMASEVRLKQYSLKQNLNKICRNEIKRFRIIIQ